MPIDKHKTGNKNSHGMIDQNTAQKWYAIYVDTPVIEHETADTERKVHLHSETSRMTSKKRMKTEKCAKNSSHHIKKPH